MNSAAHELLLTADGSHTLRSKRFGVTYHSIHGAVHESRHVFMQAGIEAIRTPATTELSILEMGFGTGLNALLVRQFAENYPAINVHYRTYELFPLDEAAAANLNYASEIGVPRAELDQLHGLPWEGEQVIVPNFTFVKHQRSFLDEGERPYAPASVDVIFYDAFAPGSQPELWTKTAMEICYAALRPGGVLVTYCAKGQFKRDLRAAGFRVEAIPGPPKKREMTRAWRD